MTARLHTTGNAFIVVLGTLVFAAGCAAFWDRYWRVRDCFNELGRCYDADRQEVLLEQAGVVWATVAAGGLGLIAVGLCRHLRARRKP